MEALLPDLAKAGPAYVILAIVLSLYIRRTKIYEGMVGDLVQLVKDASTADTKQTASLDKSAETIAHLCEEVRGLKEEIHDLRRDQSDLTGPRRHPGGK